MAETEEKAEAGVPTCVLCCNAMDKVARFDTVGECGHKGCCSICALRMRQLLGSMACVMCKTECPRVICLEREDQSFESFQDWGDNIGPTHVFDEPSGMFFLKEDYTTRVRKLRDPVCKKCGKKFATVAQLKAHVVSAHQLQYCGICLEHKNFFLGELELFSKEQLKRHNNKGKPSEGFLGHPRCDFCFSRFYSTAELYHHLHQNHFECDICLHSLHIQNRYYKDYHDLENHFRAEHFLCEEQDCLRKKFVVFKSHLDLQSHLAVEHPYIKTSRKIDVHFTVRRASRDGNDRSGDGFEDYEHFQAQGSAASGDSHTITVADFPSLSTGPQNAPSSSSFSLWENQSAARRPRAEDFPALGPSTATGGRGAGSTFRNALAPPPSAAMQAHLNNSDEWEYPELAAAADALGANNPLMRFVKPAKKSKKKKNGRKSNGNGGLEDKLTVPVAVVKEQEEQEEGEGEEEEDQGPTQSKSALVLQLRQVLGSDAKYEVFREDCKLFRRGEVELPVFYAKMRDVLSPQHFAKLFVPLMRLFPDKTQVDAFLAYHKQVTRQSNRAQGFQDATSKRSKTKPTRPADTLKPAASRRKAQPPSPSQAGWGNALKESGIRSGAAKGRKPAAIVHNTNLRSMLGRDQAPQATWSSSTSWQAAATPAPATSASAYPALGRTPASTKLQSAPSAAFSALSIASSSSSSASPSWTTTSAYAASPTPVLRSTAPPPAPTPSFKTAKSDFPELPKAGKHVGVQPVTRATWDDQVQTIAQNRSNGTGSSNGTGRGGGKKKQKKKSMTLGEMAMKLG